MEALLQKIYRGIIAGNQEDVGEDVQSILRAGADPETILKEGMISAMAEVGRLFEEGEYFVPDMLLSARAMQAALTVLKPHLIQAKIRSAGNVLIGTVQGDWHDIGKNLVAIMLEGAGFEITDLGTDVPPEKFVRAVAEGGFDILALSALLTTTMPNMQNTVNALGEAGLRDRVKIIVGGAPITESYARQIGADGYAPDASRAVGLAKSLLQ